MKITRTVLFRAAAVLALVAIACAMLVIGRGHTVYFDAKEAEYNGQKVEVPYKTVVIVNGEKVAKLYKGERGMASWMGQNFKMSVEVTKEKGGDSVTSNVQMPLPYNMDGVIINIPALLAGFPEEVYLSEFIPVPSESEEADEEIITDEFAGLTDGPEGEEPQ